MKNHSFRLIILVTVPVLCSISCSKMNAPSNFLNSFSLADAIERMNVPGIGRPSGASSSTASAGDPSPYRREFEIVIPTESMADSFDERAFLAGLEEQIRKEAIHSGVKVTGSGGGGDSFHIDYQTGKHNGGIEVIGVRTEKAKFRVWCIIRELAPGGGGDN